MYYSSEVLCHILLSVTIDQTCPAQLRLKFEHYFTILNIIFTLTAHKQQSAMAYATGTVSTITGYLQTVGIQ